MPDTSLHRVLADYEQTHGTIATPGYAPPRNRLSGRLKRQPDGSVLQADLDAVLADDPYINDEDVADWVKEQDEAKQTLRQEFSPEATGIRVLPAVAGSFFGPVGGAAGGFAGEGLAQLYEKATGRRDNMSYGTMAVQAGLNAIPGAAFAKFGKALTPAMRGLAHVAGDTAVGSVLGASGTVLGGVTERHAAEPDKGWAAALPTAEQAATEAGMGAKYGAAFGVLGSGIGQGVKAVNALKRRRASVGGGAIVGEAPPPGRVPDPRFGPETVPPVPPWEAANAADPWYYGDLRKTLTDTPPPPGQAEPIGRRTLVLDPETNEFVGQDVPPETPPDTPTTDVGTPQERAAFSELERILRRDIQPKDIQFTYDKYGRAIPAARPGAVRNRDPYGRDVVPPPPPAPPPTVYEGGPFAVQESVSWGFSDPGGANRPAGPGTIVSSGPELTRIRTRGQIGLPAVEFDIPTAQVRSLNTPAATSTTGTIRPGETITAPTAPAQRPVKTTAEMTGAELRDLTPEELTRRLRNEPADVRQALWARMSEGTSPDAIDTQPTPLGNENPYAGGDTSRPSPEGVAGEVRPGPDATPVDYGRHATQARQDGFTGTDAELQTAFDERLTQARQIQEDVLAETGGVLDLPMALDGVGVRAGSRWWEPDAGSTDFAAPPEDLAALLAGPPEEGNLFGRPQARPAPPEAPTAPQSLETLLAPEPPAPPAAPVKEPLVVRFRGWQENPETGVPLGLYDIISGGDAAHPNGYEGVSEGTLRKMGWTGEGAEPRPATIPTPTQAEGPMLALYRQNRARLAAEGTEGRQAWKNTPERAAIELEAAQKAEQLRSRAASVLPEDVITTIDAELTGPGSDVVAAENHWQKIVDYIDSPEPRRNGLTAYDGDLRTQINAALGRDNAPNLLDIAGLDQWTATKRRAQETDRLNQAPDTAAPPAAVAPDLEQLLTPEAPRVGPLEERYQRRLAAADALVESDRGSQSRDLAKKGARNLQNEQARIQRDAPLFAEELAPTDTPEARGANIDDTWNASQAAERADRLRLIREGEITRAEMERVLPKDVFDALDNADDPNVTPSADEAGKWRAVKLYVENPTDLSRRGTLASPERQAIDAALGRPFPGDPTSAEMAAWTTQEIRLKRDARIESGLDPNGRPATPAAREREVLSARSTPALDPAEFDAQMAALRAERVPVEPGSDLFSGFNTRLDSQRGGAPVTEARMRAGGYEPREGGGWQRSQVAPDLERALTPEPTPAPAPVASPDLVPAGMRRASPVKQGDRGTFLAPPDKDYIFVELPAKDPELSQRLMAAGYVFRRTQGPNGRWFKNTIKDGNVLMTPEAAEAEAAAILARPAPQADLEGLIAPPQPEPPPPTAQSARPIDEAYDTIARENIAEGLRTNRPPGSAILPEPMTPETQAAQTDIEALLRGELTPNLQRRTIEQNARAGERRARTLAQAREMGVTPEAAVTGSQPRETTIPRPRTTPELPEPGLTAQDRPRPSRAEPDAFAQATPEAKLGWAMNRLDEHIGPEVRTLRAAGDPGTSLPAKDWSNQSTRRAISPTLIDALDEIKAAADAGNVEAQYYLSAWEQTAAERWNARAIKKGTRGDPATQGDTFETSEPIENRQSPGGVSLYGGVAGVNKSVDSAMDTAFGRDPNLAKNLANRLARAVFGYVGGMQLDKGEKDDSYKYRILLAAGGAFSPEISRMIAAGARAASGKARAQAGKIVELREPKPIKQPILRPKESLPAPDGLAQVFFPKEKLNFFQWLRGSTAENLPEWAPELDRAERAFNAARANPSFKGTPQEINALRKQLFEPLAKRISIAAKDISGTSRLKSSLMFSVADALRDRPEGLSRQLDKIGFKYHAQKTVSRAAAGLTYRTLIGYNPGTAVQNATQPLLAASYMPLKYIHRGMMAAKTAAGKMRAESVRLDRPVDLIDEATYKGARINNPTLAKAIAYWKKLPVPDAMFMLRWGDNWNRQGVFLGAVEYALSKGVPEPKAMDWAKQVVYKTQGSTGILGTNPHWRGPVMSLIAPFTKFPTLFVENMAGMFARPGNEAGKLRLLATLGSLMVAGELTGLDTEDLLVSGGRPFGLDIGNVGKSVERMKSGQAFPVVKGAIAGIEHLTGRSKTPISEDLKSLLLTKSVARAATTGKELVREAGEGNMMGTHVSHSPTGTAIPHTGYEDVLNLLGLRTTRQVDLRSAYDRLQSENATAVAKRDRDLQQVKNEALKALDNHDLPGLQAAMAQLNAKQRRALISGQNRTRFQRILLSRSKADRAIIEKDWGEKFKALELR